jgi:hypothetical protein
MRIGLLSRAFRRSAMPMTAALDNETLRVCAAIEHVKARGNLDGFRADRSERVALMYTAARQGLVVWDKSASRYKLTSLGEKRLGGLRTPVDGASRADRVAGGGFVSPRMKSGLLGAFAGAAACAGLIAWLPSGPSKPPSALQAGGTAVTGPTTAATEQPALPEKEPSGTYSARMGTDGQADQLARPSFVDTSIEPQTPAGVADKSVRKKRDDAQHSRKVAHSQKKTGRRARPAVSDEGAVASGSGYGAPVTATDRYWGPQRRPPLGFAEDDLRNTGRATQPGSQPSWFFRW